jgi:hypothetical protein
MKKEKSNFRGKIASSYKRQKESRGNFGYLNLPKGIEMFKIPEDVRNFQLDFLPYKVTNERHLDRNVEEQLALPGSLWYRSPIKVHRNVGADNESVICPTTIGKKCPICEYRVKRIKEGADKEEFKLLYPQERSIYPVIPLEKGFEQVPMPWDMSDFLFQETLMKELQENEEFEDFFTLDNGKTVSLRLRWKEISKNKYPEVVIIDFQEREPYDESVLQDIPNLDTLIKILPYEEIFAKFFNEEISDDKLEDVKGEPETETPERTKRYHKVQEEQGDKEPEEEKVERKSYSRVTRKEPEAEKEVKTVSRTRTRETEKEDKCPHGLKFGVDTDTSKVCEKCEVWDPCDEEKEKSKK